MPVHGPRQPDVDDGLGREAGVHVEAQRPAPGNSLQGGAVGVGYSGLG